MEYKFKEASFELASEDTKQIFVLEQRPDYSLLRDLFAQKVHTTLKIAKTPPFAKKLTVILKCTEGCAKSYKLCCSKEAAFKGDGLHFEVWSQTEESCSCGPAAHAQIRGTERNEIKTHLTKNLPKQVQRQAALDGKKIPSQNQLKLMNQENRAALDLDRDVCVDLLKRYLKKDLACLVEVSFYIFPADGTPRFRAVLVWEDSVSLLKRYLEDTKQCPFKRLLLDATGKVTAPIHKNSSEGNRPVLHHVLLLPFPKSEDTCHLIPVGEMISDDQTGENISRFLRSVWQRLQPKHQKKLQQIGTDDSWANIHAILSLTPGMTVINYMKLAYQVFNGEPTTSELSSTVAPAYCFSHFSKNWADMLKKAFPGDHMQPTRRTIRGLLSNLTKIADPKLLDTSVKNIIRLLGAEFDSELIQSIAFGINVNEVPASQEYGSLDTNNSNLSSMYAQSPFYRHFKKFSDDEYAAQLEEEGNPNEYYSPELLDHLLKHYIAYLPWWTIYLSSTIEKNSKRSNNARVERHFRDIKDTCQEQRAQICRLGSIRVGRYLTARDKMVKADLKIVENQESRRQQPDTSISEHNMPNENDLSQKQEAWSKARRKLPTDVKSKKT